MQELTDNEPFIRLGVFLSLFFLFGCLELLIPRRYLRQPKSTRWVTNFSIAILDSLLVKWLFPLTAVMFAALCQAQGIGLFNWLALPLWVNVVVGVVLLDLAIYSQHVLFHLHPMLWRLHRMHHTDLDLDVSSAARFHPLEILLSMLIKFMVIVVLGISPVGVLIFEVVLNGMALFNHSNIRLPPWLDSGLRKILVTPDMHRVHHSIERRETNSNFGFNLSVWDRWFGTYCKEPTLGQEDMVIGLPRFRHIEKQKFIHLLIQPLK
ncbi:MAG: sterol desaturase [Gammaproteobacteria bacterium]|nr:MAG: sterol desaturase [Gammaproteobacteria bacterium]